MEERIGGEVAAGGQVASDPPTIEGETWGSQRFRRWSRGLRRANAGATALETGAGHEQMIARLRELRPAPAVAKPSVAYLRELP